MLKAPSLKGRFQGPITSIWEYYSTHCAYKNDSLLFLEYVAFMYTWHSTIVIDTAALHPQPPSESVSLA